MYKVNSDGDLFNKSKRHLDNDDYEEIVKENNNLKKLNEESEAKITKISSENAFLTNKINELNSLINSLQRSFDNTTIQNINLSKISERLTDDYQKLELNYNSLLDKLSKYEKEGERSLSKVYSAKNFIMPKLSLTNLNIRPSGSGNSHLNINESKGAAIINNNNYKNSIDNLKKLSINKRKKSSVFINDNKVRKSTYGKKSIINSIKVEEYNIDNLRKGTFMKNFKM
jgi:hypothetical protein